MRHDGLVAHLRRLADRLDEELGELLTAVWAGGSLALDDVRAASDLDAAIVVERELSAQQRRHVAEVLLASAQDVPARGLEAVVYARDDLADPGRGVHELNVNGGPGMPRHVGLPGDDPGFWFVVDLAILRAAGRAVAGPPPDELIAEVPEHAVRDALRRSLRWHRDHGGRPDDEVLNACRAWHHVTTGRWASKSQAARWATERLEGSERAAVEAAASRRVDPDRPGPTEDGARAVSRRALGALGPEVATRPGSS